MMTTEFLSLKKVDDTTALGLFKVVEATLEEYDLKWADMVAYARKSRLKNQQFD